MSRIRSALALSAVIGGIVWLVLAATGWRLSGAALGPVELLFLLAPLVLVPLGFRLGAGPGPGWLPRAAAVLQPAGAVAAVMSFTLAPGPAAAALACGWLLVSALAALSGAADLLHRPHPFEARGIVSIGFLYLALGSAWLVVSRLGATPFGFGEPIVLLTAVHFHYAGFAAAIIVAATLRRPDPRARSRGVLEVLVTIGAIAGPALVAAGFVTTNLVRFAAALILASCLSFLPVLVWRRGSRISLLPSRLLLAVSSASIVVAMFLAALYAWGELTGQVYLDIPRMVRLHGTLNALGFALCGLLGWSLEE